MLCYLLVQGCIMTVKEVLAIDTNINKRLKGMKKSKYYYDYTRNTDEPLVDERVPDYYKGNNGYEARKVVSGFDLTYNVGTAVTYLLRSSRKHSTPNECIRKAIAHLQFELEKLDEQDS